MMIHTRPDFGMNANPSPLTSKTSAKISENAATAVFRTAARTSLKPILRGGLGSRAIVSRTKPATEDSLLREIETPPRFGPVHPRVERTHHSAESLEDPCCYELGATQQVRRGRERALEKETLGSRLESLSRMDRDSLSRMGCAGPQELAR